MSLNYFWQFVRFEQNSQMNEEIQRFQTYFQELMSRPLSIYQSILDNLRNIPKDKQHQNIHHSLISYFYALVTLAKKLDGKQQKGELKVNNLGSKRVLSQNEIIQFQRQLNYRNLNKIQLSVKYNLCPLTVSKYIRMYNRFGEIRKASKKSFKRKDSLMKSIRDKVSLIYTENPALNLLEISNILRDRYDISACRNTISRSLKCLTLTKTQMQAQKDLIVGNSETNRAIRRQFAEYLTSNPSKHFIFIDQTLITKFRDQPKVAKLAQIDSISVILAMDRNGIIGWKLKKGAFRIQHIHRFIEEVLQKYPSSAFVLDTNRYHKNNQMDKFVQQKQLPVTFVPPFSPQLNPCAAFFSKLKSKIKNQINHSIDLQSKINQCLEITHNLTVQVWSMIGESISYFLNLAINQKSFFSK